MIGVYFDYLENGPGKVVRNLLKGFDNNKIDYKINSDADINLILQGVDRLSGDLSNCIIGPNISTLPIDNRYLLDHKRYLKTIVPCQWVKSKYSRWIPEKKIEIWPVGIDTDIFIDYKNFNKEYDFLVYFKRREKNELLAVINFLETKRKSYIVIEYGKYSEHEFINAIAKSKYCIVIDKCESQGIAIQEMMSCNLPLLVWNVSLWDDRGSEYICDSTSIPYFSDKCGEIFYDFNDIENKFEQFINNEYKPRDFILENLSIEKSTNKILEIIYKID